MELRIKPLGIIVLLIIIGLVGGGLVWWSHQKGAEDTAEQFDISKQARGEIVFASSKTKKDWLDDEARQFNTQQAGKVTVRIEYGETRDSYQEIINGKMKPALWAPSSTQWIGALGNYWQTNHNKPLFDTSKADEYKLYLKTPMVLLTTREKATFLRPLLGASGKTWDNIGDLSTRKIHTPWGSFKYAYADPVTAGSGFMILSMIMTDYAQKHTNMTMDQIVKSSGFLQHLKALNTSFVYDAPGFKGSTDLFNSFMENPNRYDFICTYESNALKLALTNPKYAVIYPNPTGTVDMSIVLFSGADWLSPEQIAAGKLFMQFLGEKEAMEAGVKTAFRTATSMPGISLTPELDKGAAQGFQESFTAAELPSYEPVNAAAAIWRQVTKTPADVADLQKQSK